MNLADAKQALLDRLVRYARIGTQSSMEKADGGCLPSSESQIFFAKTLLAELHSLGIQNASLDDNGYILATIPASKSLEAKPSFGLCSHVDTSGEAPGDNVQPLVHHQWNGTPIALNEGFVLDPANDADLAGCVGHTIITSDGTTLLGADDKAGLAGIMTLAEYLLANPQIKHGPIEILFSPDEETGHGMDNVPLARLASKAFYTVDGGEAGELEAECFNAWRADIGFTGVSAHLGKARGKMTNALTMQAAFISALPQQESPETTDGYEGYFCPLEAKGGVESAELTVFIRDFDEKNMDQRLKRLDAIAAGIEARFPEGKITVKKTCQYLNMKQKLNAEPVIVERLTRAAERAGITPKFVPIRGGTDGSRLTQLGIPTPNLFTGGHNYHSRTEWASLEQMEKMFHTLIELAKIWGE